MKTTTYIAFILIYVVVLAGSVVRMTGSGMGCPDWPKCFGLLIPPTSEEEIRWSPETEYSEGRMVIERDTLWVATQDHISQKGGLNAHIWEPYTRHSYATFNVSHTWIEYLNRLAGALAGIPILILFILAIKSRQRTPIVLASATLGSVLFVSWLGKLVVDGNLIPFSVTIHAVSALAILAFLVMLIQHFNGTKTNISKSLRWWIGASLVIAFLQLVLGTQVREFVDIAIETGVARTEIVNSLPKWWGIHKSAVWLIIALHAIWAFPITKMPRLAVYAKLTFAILLAETMTGILFIQFGFPAFAQPVHILLGFALVLVDLRILLSTKVA
ncbi:MAG: COX15/CtaA family protein [Bacteroidetes bacterium]|nr:COX15/CtaA family protein [Bacteroidota bacterium]